MRGKEAMRLEGEGISP